MFQKFEVRATQQKKVNIRLSVIVLARTTFLYEKRTLNYMAKYFSR